MRLANFKVIDILEHLVTCEVDVSRTFMGINTTEPRKTSVYFYTKTAIWRWEDGTEVKDIRKLHWLNNQLLDNL